MRCIVSIIAIINKCKCKFKRRSYNCTNYFKIWSSPKSANCSCFRTTTISFLALCPALCPIRTLAPASPLCGRPHCTDRLISELSPA
ncbi:hypothetical protein PILCRDRAFT_668388 [Piloderma croceum F 1598]|uniref:Uncharacterized protein n=1 Tax=Piloderma croceum (strain F 1598) TaxID=765440 RepID=A0A0C3F6T4_PILCF|nr:hypothetical protein PILCRDRAFT_668388 [Piloderma croceum F 1598]